MDIINIIKSELKKLIKENIDFKKLEKENKFTIPKIKSENIFLNPVGSLSKYDTIEVDKLIDNEEYTYLPIKFINIKDIIPTQKFLNINNLKSVKNISNSTDAILLSKKNKYYILDGHHRIAVNILNGFNKIKAFVF